MGQCKCGNNQMITNPEKTKIYDKAPTVPPSSDALQYLLLGGIVIIIVLILNKKC
jgi:hypothetical protein